MHLNRSKAAEMGREAVRIIEAGHYQVPSGEWVEIADLIQRAVEGTCSYPPEQRVRHSLSQEKDLRTEVVNKSTLAAALRLVEEGLRPAALNFASAKHPGGGFLGGARAQEESLARSSGLYACLRGND